MSKADEVFQEILTEDAVPKKSILKRVPVRESLLDDTPYSMNVADIPSQKAYEIAREEFAKEGMNVDQLIPNFEDNYQSLRQKVQEAPDIPRNRMPVIEPNEIDDFQDDLQSGKVDIFAPYAFDSPTFPEKFPSRKGVTADEWIELGTVDGATHDDPVQARLTEIPVSSLSFTQGEVWLEKVIGSIVRWGIPDQSSPILDTTIIVSEDHYILDGHHRTSQAMVADPSLKMSVLEVPLDIDLLLDVARSYSKATGHEFKD